MPPHNTRKNSHSGAPLSITSGKYRGRRLSTPDGRHTHPMGARQKLALFNMLSAHLSGARLLDAYAGTGALGLEALSRGASSVDFIECDQTALCCLRQNLSILDEKDRSSVTIFAGKASNFASDAFYNVILVDPPYDHFRPSEVDYLASFLAPGGILALSHPGNAPILPGFALIKSNKYAKARISLYQKSNL